MSKEKRIDVKAFIKEHKYEIILGTGLLLTGVTIRHCKKDIVDLVEIALNSLRREERRIMFEMDEIYDSIERLDKEIPINRFHKIPKRLARIEELEVDLKTVRKQIAKVKSK